MNELASIQNEIERGLEKMRAEVGIASPYRMPRASFAWFLFAFALVGGVVAGLIR